MDDAALAETLMDGGEPPPEPEPDPLADYWARGGADTLPAELRERDRKYLEVASRYDLPVLWKLSYAQQFGYNPNAIGQSETQQILPDGDIGELLMFRINEVRSFSRQQLGMTVGNRPAFKTVTTNTDYASSAQVETSDALVTSLYRADMGEAKERTIAESDQVFGSGWGWMRWDQEAGTDVKWPVLDDEPQPDGSVKRVPRVEPRQMPDGSTMEQPVTELKPSGMPVGTALYPWEVTVDPWRRAGDHDWATVHERCSRWELMATWPDKAEELRNIRTTEEHGYAAIFGWNTSAMTEDDVIVKHFYHRASKAIPGGRYVGLCGDVILWDLPCPVPKGLPLAEMCTSRLIGTAYGHGDIWDLMSINQAIDQLASDAITNYAGFARPTMVADKGTDFDPQALADGRKFLLKDQTAMVPQMMTAAAMPDGVMQLFAFFKGELESVSGLNAAARGNAEGVKSGQHAALLHSIAAEFQNMRQAALDQFRERWANLMLDMVRLNAETPLIVEVVGDDQRTYAREFSKQDAAGVRRVYVETASPLLRTIAGRMELYDKVKDLPPKERRAAIEMIVTGQMGAVTRVERTATLYIKWENEQLVKGIPVEPTAIDDPIEHIREHRAELFSLLVDPQRNAKAIETVLGHIYRHAYVFRGVDGVLAALAGLPPPPPPPGMQQQPGAPPMGPRAPGRPAAPPGAPPQQRPPATPRTQRKAPVAVGGRVVDETTGQKHPSLPRPSPGSGVVGAARAPMSEGTPTNAA